jgi:GT2 family glycosyltransferase
MRLADRRRFDAPILAFGLAFVCPPLPQYLQHTWRGVGSDCPGRGIGQHLRQNVPAGARIRWLIPSSPRVIIPNFNGLRFLPACLGALREQTFPQERTQVILVDDGSTDGSTAYVAEHFPEVCVLALPSNRGLAAACNAGVHGGDLLVMLNNDTEVEPGWLEALVRMANAHTEAGVIASKMLLHDRRDVLHNAGDVMGCDGIPRNRGVWQQDTGQFDEETAIFGGCGGGAGYRREAWVATGGFDERLFMYLEDVDLAWRLQLLG